MPYDYDGSTNQFASRGISPDLQSIIDKVSGSFSGVSKGRVAQLQAGLGEKAMGIMGGLQQQGMQDTAALDRAKLGISGQETVAKIGVEPHMKALEPVPGSGLLLESALNKKSQSPGIGASTTQPATGNWWELFK